MNGIIYPKLQYYILWHNECVRSSNFEDFVMSMSNINIFTHHIIHCLYPKRLEELD